MPWHKHRFLFISQTAAHTLSFFTLVQGSLEKLSVSEISMSSPYRTPVRSFLTCQKLRKGKLVNWDSVRRKQMDYIYHCNDKQWSWRWYMHPHFFSISPKIWSRHCSFTTIIYYQEVYYVKSFTTCDETFTVGSHFATWVWTILVYFQCC